MSLPADAIQESGGVLPSRQEAVLPTAYGGPVPVLMSLVFLAAGMAIMALGTGLLPADPASFKAPRWVVVMAGGVFAGGGLLVGLGALQAWKFQQLKQRTKAANPGVYAFEDYPWNPEKSTTSRWGLVIRNGLVIVLAMMLMTTLTYMVVSEGDAPFWVWGVVAIMDLVLIYSFLKTVQTGLQTWKTSPGEVRWKSFPLRLGQPLEIFWGQPVGEAPPAPWTGGHFVLRCVEESAEVRGTGKRRSTVYGHRELWSEKLEAPPFPGMGEPVHLVFHPPADLPETWLSSPKPRFWELEVELETPGAPRKERFLLPVYKEDGRS